MEQRSRRIARRPPPALAYRARRSRTRAAVVVGIAAAAVFVFTAETARADVVRDGRVGTAGAGPVATEIGGAGELRYLIRESDGQRAGDHNLFHSFRSFDLTSNETAVYQGPAGIRNLITTITGGRSSIDGKIQSEIEGANLYLINPEGIVFGEHASVDLSGALAVSTADRLIFSNGERVETGGAAPPSILSVADPIGFGFLGTAAPISLIGSRIELRPDSSLAMIGGDITLSGRRTDGNGAVVSIPSGRLDLVSLSSPGDVTLLPQGVRIDGAPTRGDVVVADDIVISTSGLPVDSPFVRRGTPLIPGSGPIFVRARDLTIRDAQVRTLTVTSEDASPIDIGLTGVLTIAGGIRPESTGIFADTGFSLSRPAGETVLFTDFDNRPDQGTVIETDVCVSGAPCGVRYNSYGNAGDVRVRAREVRLLNGGKIRATSEFEGRGGTIEVDFRDEMVVSGRRGPDDVSLITTNANGKGLPGSIRIQSESGRLGMGDYGALLIQNGLLSLADRFPGQITVDVAELAMSGNARIDSSTRGAGPGGILDVTARDRITLTGRTDDENFTGISTLSQPGSTGDAGEIRVTTRDLVMSDGAEISARPADATSRGAAGNLSFDIRDRLVMRGATISTQSPNAAGGNIDLGVSGVVAMRSSAITTSVTAGPESGGNITLRPGPDALVLGNSQIIARADEGAGGTIDLEARIILRDSGSAIDATSRRGINGRVLINGVEGNILPEVAQLATPSADVSSLVREPCAARRPGASNRFVIDERPRLSVDSDDYLGVSLTLALEGDGNRAAADRAARVDRAKHRTEDAAQGPHESTRVAQENGMSSSGCLF